MKSKKLWIQIGIVLAAAAMMGLYAYINRYPIMYSDLGSYLRSGFDRVIPIDRPLTYGWLIRHMSLAETLYLSLAGQLIIMATTLYIWFLNFFKPAHHKYFLPVIAGLVLFSSLSYQASQLLPDAFTSMVFLTSSALLLAKPKKYETWWMIVWLVFSVATHLSHGMMICLWGGFVLLHILFSKLTDWKRPILLWASSVAVGILILPLTGLLIEGHFGFNRGSPIFLFQKLNWHGIAYQYLDEECPNPDLELCPYKDDLGGDFLWNYPNSPLYQLGGWEATYQMFDSINHEMLSRPKWLWRFVTFGLRDAARQVTIWRMEDMGRFDETGPMYYPISARLNDGEPKRFLNARQNQEGFDLKSISNMHLVIYWISLFVCLGLLFVSTPDVRRVILFMLLFLIINALICGMLSDIIPRYQNRVIWLMPFVATLGLMRLDARSLFKKAS